MSDTSPETSLAEAFHRISSLVPPGQTVFCAQRDWTVGQALQVMKQHSYTQLPVVSGNYVMGVFSYRSLASRLMAWKQVPGNLTGLPVEEFTEQLSYVQPTSNWEASLDALDRQDALLVGNQDSLLGILTTVDVLRYLHHLAKPFVILAEIEVSLRRLMAACVPDDELATCAMNALAGVYGERPLPSSLEEMTFSEYRQIICDRENWERFAPAFGASEFQRSETFRHLEEVREVRNTVFHFRQSIEPDVVSRLERHRDWLERKVRAFEGQRRATRRPEKAPEAEKQSSPRTQRRQRRWDEASYFADISQRQSAAIVAVSKSLLAWANKNTDHVIWGTGLHTGSFTPRARNRAGTCSLFNVRSAGTIQIAFGSLRNCPPYESKRLRADVAARLHQIPGVFMTQDDIDRWPSMDQETLAEPDRLSEFLAIFDDVIRSIREAD